MIFVFNDTDNTTTAYFGDDPIFSHLKGVQLNQYVLTVEILLYMKAAILKKQPEDAHCFHYIHEDMKLPLHPEHLGGFLYSYACACMTECSGGEETDAVFFARLFV